MLKNEAWVANLVGATGIAGGHDIAFGSNFDGGPSICLGCQNVNLGMIGARAPFTSLKKSLIISMRLIMMK